MSIIRRLIVVAVCASCLSAGPATQPTESFDLEVKLNDIYNPDFSMTTIIRFGEPFVVRITNGKLTNIFWGQLDPPKEEKYGLDLSICEWVSPESNLTETTRYDLKLDEAQSGGPVSSFVYLRTVTLKRHISRTN